MVAPEADCIHLVALWAAQTVACFLHAAWCCSAVVLQAASSTDDDSSSLCLPTSKQKQKPRKLVPAWLPPLQQHIGMCILQQPQPQLQQHQHQHQRLALPTQLQYQQLLAELDIVSKAGRPSQSLVSTPKPQGPNRRLPALTQPQAGDTADESGPAPAPSNASTQGTGCSGAVGQSSSSASGSSSAQGSHHSSGQNSLPPGGGGDGGGDDSDDGGDDKRRLAHQLAKSHSLETPDPLIAGSNTASLIQAAVDRAQRGPAAAEEAAPADRRPVARTPAAAVTAAAAATGPWRLPSPFAAAAAMEQATAAGPSQVPAAAGQAPVSPFAAVQPEASEPSTQPNSTAVQQPATGGATGPQKLPSTFAAVSASASRAASSASQGASSSPQLGAAGRVSKPGSPAAPRPAQQPSAAYSPFAAAQPGVAYTSPFGSSSSSSGGGGGSGSSGSRQAAATAAAAYAASRASKGSSSSVGSRGPAAVAAATTGPWKLHSPFAAAPVPAFSATSMQLDAVAEEEPLDVTGAGVSGGGQSQLRPTQQSVDAVVAAAAAARKQQRQRQQRRTSPARSAASSGHSSYSSLSSRPPTPSAARAGSAGSRRSTAAGSSSPMHPAGPGGIRSPFAAAAAVAAATDAAFTPRGTPKTSPTGSTSDRAAWAGGSPTHTSSAQTPRKGSAAAGSSAGHVSNMAHSISLSSLMYPGGAGGSSVLSDSTADHVPPRDTSSGSIATIGTKFSGGQGLGGSSSLGRGSGSTGSFGAGAGTSTPPAADDAAAAALSAQEQQQQQQPRRLPPSAHPTQQQLALQTAVQSPFAAASWSVCAGRVAPAASRAVPQQVTFRPTVMPIAVSSPAGTLMPPVLMAMPPTPQQMAADVSYQAAQASSLPSLVAAPDGRGLAAASAPAVLMPQYALPTTAGLLASTAGAGLISVPLSAGMPAVLVHPSLLQALQSPAAPVIAAPSAARRQQTQAGSTAAWASPFATAQPVASAAASPAASSTASVRPAASASAAGSAVSGASAVAPKLGCMCVAPACLAEGASSQVQVYILGLEGKRVQQGHTYKVAAFMGSNLVAEAKRECKGGERLLRISLPALPKGVVQLLVVDGSNKPCFMQHLLVLPPPCAQDLNTLWSQVLRGQIRVTPPGAAPDASSTAAARTPGASLYGSSDSSKGAGTSSSSSSVTSAAPALPAVSAASQQAAGQPERLGPLEIQDLWRNSYSRVLTDIAAVLLTRSKSTELPTGAMSASIAARAAAATAAAAARAAAPVAGISPRTSFDTPEMRDRVGTLLHFFATHSKWAVVELMTSHVYGYGSSAKAMFTSKVLPAVQQPAGLGAAAVGPAASPVPAPAAAAAAADAPAMPAAAASPSPAAAPARPMQWLQPPSTGEIQPDTDEQPGSGGSGHSFSFADVRSIFDQRPMAESRSLAPASSGATATARSGGDASFAAAAAADAAAGPPMGRVGGERGLGKVLRVKRVLKRAFSSKP